MDSTIFVFVLIVTLSRSGNPALASSNVESVNNFSNANTLKAKESLMPLISMGNVEEIEKFGKREIEREIKLPSLIRKARCKHSRLSWGSKKEKKNWGLSIMPLKHISLSRSTSADGGTEDSSRKPDIRVPSVARARDLTNNFENPSTTKRENEHGVEEIVMLPPQTVDSVVVISEGARPASDESPKSFVVGTFDTKEKGTKMSKVRPTFYTLYEVRERPASKSEPTKIGIPLNSALRNLDEPSDDSEDPLSDEHDVNKPPTNKLELDDCIKNYGLEHCIPVPGEFRSSVRNYQSEAHDQRPKTLFHSVYGNLITEQPQNEQNEQTNHQSETQDGRPKSSFHLVHGNPITEQPDTDLPVPTTAKYACVDSPAVPQNDPEEIFPKFPSNNNQRTPDTRQPFGINQNVLFPQLARKIAQEHISHPSNAGKSTYQDPLVGNAMIQNTRNLDGSSNDPEDSLLDEHDMNKPPANKLELDDCVENYGLENCIPVSGEFRSSVQNIIYASIYDGAGKPKKDHNFPKFRTAAQADSLKRGSSTDRPKITDELALARRLILRIPEVQHLALQDTKLFLSDMKDLSTFDLSMAQMADETLVTLMKNVADYLSKAIEADLQPVAQLAGQIEWNDQQTLPDESLKQYIKNLLHYSGLTAEGVQSEASKNILFRTIQHTLKNTGFKVNNAHIWDTLKTVISQTRLPRMNPIPVFPSEERTSMIRSADMSESGFKRLPFIPVKERVLKDGRWAEKTTLLGSGKDRFEPKSRKTQSKKVYSQFTTERMDQVLLADSGKSSPDVAESVVGKSSPMSGEFVTNEEENEKTPIKYYSQAGRLLAYRKKIQVPKVMFHLEEEKKVFPRAPGPSPIADSSFPLNFTSATENGLKFTKDWSKSIPSALSDPHPRSSEQFREKPESLSNFDLHDNHEELSIPPRSETGFKSILKKNPDEQVTKNSLDAARNSKRGTAHQQNANKRMITSQDRVSEHEQSSLIDGYPSATPEDDPTYFGKMTFTSAESPPGQMSDLTDPDLFYIGDGVKIPLKLSRMSDGSWGLSISEKICESFGKKNCPCNVPSEGDIVEEKRRQKKNSSFTENTGRRPIPKNHSLIAGIRSSVSHIDQPKERRTRSYLENDLRTTSLSPVTEFVEKYNVTLDPKNLFNSSGPWPNSAALNNDIKTVGSRTNGESSSTTPDLECTENGKRTINDIIPKNRSQSDDDDVPESSKNSNFAEDENWNIVRGSHETINESNYSKSAQNVGSTMSCEDNKVNDPPKDNVSHKPIDNSINSTNVRDLRSTMNYQDNIIDPNVLDLHDVRERKDNNIMGTPITNEMNSHFAESPRHPMSSRSPAHPESSKIDNVLQAGRDETMDRWSWIHDLVDSQRKHNVLINSQDIDEAILLKIDDMFESENDKVNSAKNLATTISYQPDVTSDRLRTRNENNDNPMLDEARIAEPKFRKIDDPRETKHSEFGVNSIDSIKESELVQNGRPRANDRDTDEPNRAASIHKKKLKDLNNFFRISNVETKSDSRRDNPISKRTRLVNKKLINARPYRYQQYIDDEAQERMDLMTGVLYWLKEVFFEPSAESDD